MTVAATEHPTAPRNAGKHNNGDFTPGSSQWHTVGDGEPALVLASTALACRMAYCAGCPTRPKRTIPG